VQETSLYKAYLKARNTDPQEIRRLGNARLKDLKDPKNCLHQLELNRAEALSLGGKPISEGNIETQVKYCLNSK